jgi:translocation and assembly module TamA
MSGKPGHCAYNAGCASFFDAHFAIFICHLHLPFSSAIFMPTDSPRVVRPATAAAFATLARLATLVGQAAPLCHAGWVGRLAGTSLVIGLLAGASPGWAVEYQVEIRAAPELKSLLEKNLDLVRWRGNQKLDAAQVQRLFSALEEQSKTLLRSEGLFDPKLTSSLDQSLEPWKITLDVVPGEHYRVEQVDLQVRGLDAARQPNLATLRAAWPLPVGSLFRPALWESAKRATLRQLLLERYPRAQLQASSADVDLDKGQVRLALDFDSGPQVEFGELAISGLRHYPAEVVTRLNKIRPGDVYSEAALLELQAALQDSRYFASVAVSADLGPDDAEPASASAPGAASASASIPAADGTQATHTGEAPAAALAAASSDTLPPAPLGRSPRRVPVQVNLVEQRLKKVDLGLGYSTNTGNRLSFGFSHLDLWRTQFTGNLTLETRKQTLRGEWLLPRGADGVSDSLASAFERTDLNGEVSAISTLAIKRTRGSPVLSRSLTLEYQTERKTVDGFPTSISHALPLTWQWTVRRFDSLLFPTRGHALSVQFGGTPVRLLSDEPFVRASAKYLGYWPLAANQRILTRFELGGLASRHKTGIPSSYLFRAGGDQSVRGYGLAQLGEKQGDAVIGARYLATLSGEYQYWPRENWGAALFYDAGNASDSVAGLRPKSGYGAGGRWKSPVGPINVDLAYGRALRQYRLHFSLGVTF